ncbi:unnamed protein product [Allacma fusca]|uniref:C2H2-type domain-containing protein n=1 Tax=Allacma fusca TaxID=39272 RepID=A0A8J2KSR4_9HEXA|nr:unnamed protein product [Allacma fusca]
MHNPATHNRYTCDVCNESFRHLNTIKKHLQMKHSRTDRCDRCRRSFSDLQEFDGHLKIGEVSYGCSDCPQSLPSQCMFFQHQRTHQNSSTSVGVEEKSMKGEGTKKRISSESRTVDVVESDANPLQNPGLRTTVVPFKKSDSGPMHCRGSKVSSTMVAKSNVKSIQIHEPAMTSYTCEICFEVFSQEAHLKYHERTQHRNATWTCKRCGASFSRKYRLKHHEMVHENPKPFSCDKCSRAYIHQHDLKKHLRIHEDEKPYKCDQCPSSFPTNTYLKRHLLLCLLEKL